MHAALIHIHPHSPGPPEWQKMLCKLAKHLFVGRSGVVNSKNGSSPISYRDLHTVNLVLSNQLYSCALMSTLNWQFFRWQVYSTSLRVEAGLGGGRMLEERKWCLVSSRPQSKLDLAARTRGGASSNPIQYESKEPGSCFSLFCASSWRLIMEMSGGVEEKEVYQVTPLRWVRILLWTLQRCETTLTS